MHTAHAYLHTYTGTLTHNAQHCVPLCGVGVVFGLSVICLVDKRDSLLAFIVSLGLLLFLPCLTGLSAVAGHLRINM